MDNPVAPVLENPVDPVDPSKVLNPHAPQTPEVFSWKRELNPDYANSPTMLKFPDTKDGFNDVVKSHLSLEKMLGHEKVPVPKGKDDVEAWARFSKAFGIPDKPEGYSLPDVEIPESMKGLTFDKKEFAKVVHDQKLTPEAAKGLWEAYTDLTVKAYAKALKTREESLSGIINELRNEWGDAYQSKVALGQLVINKFTDNKETNDFITATLTTDPRGIKFLAKLGDQFAENKIGDFKYQRHSLTPDEAQREIDSIRRDMNHPYNNDKLPQVERDRAIDYVNGLIAVAKRPRG